MLYIIDGLKINQVYIEYRETFLTRYYYCVIFFGRYMSLTIQTMRGLVFSLCLILVVISDDVNTQQFYDVPVPHKAIKIHPEQ